MLSYSNMMILMTFTVLVFAFIGIVYSKGKITIMDDFLTARGRVDTKMLSTSIMASFLGVFLLFTPPEAASIGGIATITGYALGVVALFSAYIVLGPRIKEYMPMGSTLSDYVGKRYGGKMYSLTSIISIFYMIVHLVAELTAIALVANLVAGVPMIYTALLVGFGTMIYTAYGGLRASIFTDMLQMILVILLLVATSIGVVYYGGGISILMDNIRINAPHLKSFGNWSGIEYGLTLCIAVFVANFFHQGYWQRIYAAKDNEVLKKSFRMSLILAFPIMLVVGFIGIAAAGMGLADNPSVALFSLVFSLFPKGLIIGVFILALVLVMSTTDTLLNAIVSTFTIDSKRIFKNVKEEALLKSARIMTVIIIIPIAFIASKGYSVLYLFLIADTVCAGVFFPLFFGLYSKKATENIALVSAILGIASGIPFFIANKLFLSFLIPIIVSGSICLLSVNFIKVKAKA
ncbi:sodium:solute symporter family transporter [Alkaliphilus serpentinus]|uniref:Na+/proline symporter n=1 Tax=Alkaliphilus serpentinus TaxID=1482731 RepID=A0A833HQA1_9FIRM|nr:Na+/proline symporter [Alkaliphilus serpentinus]KAB3531527.1 Na+/proline symporter [Alkaliphilus serpentinus]